jgi:hypothetical protein
VQHVADIAADEDPVVDVHLAELEVGVAVEGAQVVGRARDEVVEREHAHAAREKRLAEVRTDEPGAA